MFCRVAALALLSLTVVPAALAQGPGPGRPIEPTSSYKVSTIHGFRVLVSRRLLEHEAEADEVLGELGAQLERVTKVVPAKPLALLRNVPFWVERDFLPDKAAIFRPSAQNLRNRGENPDKAGGVEISNARNFVDWSRRDQPCAALHELAHAYHFFVLGFGNPAVLHAYQQAKEQGLYGNVQFITGGEKPAYAATEPREYFAELTEAYFGKNDFYPFTRDDLKEYDPAGYRLMQQAWGKPLDETSPAKGPAATSRSGRKKQGGKKVN